MIKQHGNKTDKIKKVKPTARIKIPTYILELDIRFISKKMYLEQVLTHDYCLMMMMQGGDT